MVAGESNDSPAGEQVDTKTVDNVERMADKVRYMRDIAHRLEDLKSHITGVPEWRDAVAARQQTHTRWLAIRRPMMAKVTPQSVASVVVRSAAASKIQARPQQRLTAVPTHLIPTRAVQPILSQSPPQSRSENSSTRCRRLNIRGAVQAAHRGAQARQHWEKGDLLQWSALHGNAKPGQTGASPLQSYAGRSKSELIAELRKAQIESYVAKVVSSCLLPCSPQLLRASTVRRCSPTFSTCTPPCMPICAPWGRRRSKVLPGASSKACRRKHRSSSQRWRRAESSIDATRRRCTRRSVVLWRVPPLAACIAAVSDPSGRHLLYALVARTSVNTQRGQHDKGSYAAGRVKRSGWARRSTS